MSVEMRPVGGGGSGRPGPRVAFVPSARGEPFRIRPAVTPGSAVAQVALEEGWGGLGRHLTLEREQLRAGKESRAD